MRVCYFEIPVDDPDRAAQFYQDIFGWKIQRWKEHIDYWLVTTGPDDKPGIDGGFMLRRDPLKNVVNTIEVESVDEFAEKVVAKGGNLVVPKTAVTGVGYMAYCLDTEGNMFGIMELDETAQ